MSKQQKKSENIVPRKERLAKATALLTKEKYTLVEAANLLPRVSMSRFSGSITLNAVLKLKEKQANESIRGSVVFPHQFGEMKRVLVLAEGEKVSEAKLAGADFAGLDEFVSKIDSGWLDFDVVISTPSVMPKIARLGKVLGPRQLMPNPKTGTVTDNIKDAVKSYKSGKVDFKIDAGKTIKVRVAKVDMDPEKIVENTSAAIDAIKAETRRLGPTAISKMILSPTMGPSLELSA